MSRPRFELALSASIAYHQMRANYAIDLRQQLL